MRAVMGAAVLALSANAAQAQDIDCANAMTQSAKNVCADRDVRASYG